MKKKLSAKKRILIILAALIAIVTIEDFSLCVTDYSIKTDKFSAELEGFTVVQLSDVHMIRRPSQAERILSKTAAAEPDFIVITGDLIDTRFYAYHPEKRQDTVSFAAQLAEIAPVFYIYGNHELILMDSPQKNEFKLALEDVGVTILNNKSTRIKKNAQTIYLMGLQDPATMYSGKKTRENNEYQSRDVLTGLLAGADSGSFELLLAHRPELFSLYTAELNVDLTLTGHAHGGQFRLPFVNAGLYAPSQGFFPKYTSGSYSAFGNTMIVSRGIGNSRIPVRVFNTPEINVIKITGE